MKDLNVRLALLALGIGLLFSVAGYGQNPFTPSEPIVVNYAHAYPTVPTPPGSAFFPVAYNLNSILDQLAHSSTGVVRLPPGDYSIPVRLY